MKIIIIIFSKDRAMQLDATLRSFCLHCTDWLNSHIYVLFKTNNSLYERQYLQLINDYGNFPNYVFIRETDFYTNILRIISSNMYSRRSYLLRYFLFKVGKISSYLRKESQKTDLNSNILFFVDDNIFTHDFNLGSISNILEVTPNSIGFSLRLGKNTTYNYPMDCAQTVPIFDPLGENYVVYDWTQAHGDFKYPLEISSSMYRLKDITYLLYQLPYRNPNQLESRLATYAARSRKVQGKYPLLVCFDRSVTFCNPVNRVQSVNSNRSGNKDIYTAGNLAQLFNKGYRIDVESFTGFISNSCHQEVDFIFNKPK